MGWRVTGTALAGVALMVPSVAGAACPASPHSNGTGYRPPANARSLPAGAGPEILHRPLARSPQLDNTRNWRAKPIMVSGATAYRRGEFLYQDFLYDDRALAYPAQPERYAGNAADIVEVRVAPLASATAIRITFNSMLDPDAVAATIALGGGTSDARAVPHGAGVAMAAEVFVTAHGCTGDLVRASDGKALAARPRVTTDLRRRQLDVRVPYGVFDPRGRSVRVGAATGLWDAGQDAYLRPDPAKPAFFNVAFRDQGPWVVNTWKDESQDAALAAGDLSPLHAVVDFAKLAAGTRDNRDVPRTGPMNRILVSHYEGVQGRGNSGGGDIFGAYACDPPQCTYQYSGRLQPYSVYVPDKPRPARGYGFVVNLHGASSNHNHFELGSTEPPLSVWRMLAEQGHPSIMMMPNARGSTYCYFGLAGADVFEAWADVAAHYRLDPRQALLSGSSMGGYGVYKLATQFPDLFKAIFPNIAPEICNLAEAAAGAGEQTGATGLGRTFAGLRNVPILATAGLNDPLVNYGITSRTLRTFDELGLRFDFWHFQGTTGGQGHAEYRQFVREQYGELSRGVDAVDRDPRHVSYVLNGNVSDARYGMASDHAYWVSGLRLADAAATPPLGTIDVVSRALAKPEPLAGPLEESFGPSLRGSMPWTRVTRSPRASAIAPASSAFTMTASNLSSASLDVRRMQLPEFGTFTADVESDGGMALRLVGAFGRRTRVALGGAELEPSLDRLGATLALPAGASELRVSQPVPISLSSCRGRRMIRVRVRAPRGDRVRVVRVTVGGRLARTVRRQAGRPIAVALPRAGALVTVVARTRAGRRLERRRTYQRCL